jgi:hypothetical protein
MMIRRKAKFQLILKEMDNIHDARQKQLRILKGIYMIQDKSNHGIICHYKMRNTVRIQNKPQGKLDCLKITMYRIWPPYDCGNINQFGIWAIITKLINGKMLKKLENFFQLMISLKKLKLQEKKF